MIIKATIVTSMYNTFLGPPISVYLCKFLFWGLSQGWVNQFCSGFCFVHGVGVVRPTVKTVGYYRSAPPGREGNSVLEGQAKIARSFKAGLSQHASTSFSSGTGLVSSVLVSASFIWHLLLQHVTPVGSACLHVHEEYACLLLKSLPACSRRVCLHAPEVSACMLLKSLPACSRSVCLHAPEVYACMLPKCLPACISPLCWQVPEKHHYASQTSACFSKFLFWGLGEFSGEGLVEDGLFEFCQGVEFFLVDSFKTPYFRLQRIQF